jgi:sugar/nucleoside kinase (ribokinase family)
MMRETQAARAVVVGNPVADEIRHDGTLARHAEGGTATYASLALRRLGLEVDLIGAIGFDHAAMLRAPLAAAAVGLQYLMVRGESSTSYELAYDSQTGERRVQLAAAGPRIEPADLPHKRPKGTLFVHVGPVAGEATAEVIGAVARWGVPIGIDLHALRRFAASGAVTLGSAEEVGLPFAAFDVVKGAIAELRAFAPSAGTLGACMHEVAHHGAHFVLATDGARGAIMLTPEREFITIPAYPVREVDATGAGDVFLAGFLYGRFVAALAAQEAATFAAAAASFVVQGEGASVLGDVAGIEARRQSLQAHALREEERRDWGL